MATDRNGIAASLKQRMRHASVLSKNQDGVTESGAARRACADSKCVVESTTYVVVAAP
jgi:hypothetical protein